jgi:hypothetical protein
MVINIKMALTRGRKEHTLKIEGGLLHCRWHCSRNRHLSYRAARAACMLTLPEIYFRAMLKIQKREAMVENNSSQRGRLLHVIFDWMDISF